MQVLTDEDCWNWTGAMWGDYGCFKVDGKNRKAHRLAQEWESGPIPDGLCVCHHCDNPRCCNPSHFFLGTRTDNNQDRARKGRSAKGEALGRALREAGTYQKVPFGERAYQALLTDDQVREIRERHDGKYGTGARLAREYGVDPVTISAIRTGRNWKRVK